MAPRKNDEGKKTVGYGAILVQKFTPMDQAVRLRTLPDNFLTSKGHPEALCLLPPDQSGDRTVQQLLKLPENVRFKISAVTGWTMKPGEEHDFVLRHTFTTANGIAMILAAPVLKLGDEKRWDVTVHPSKEAMTFQRRSSGDYTCYEPATGRQVVLIGMKEILGNQTEVTFAAGEICISGKKTSGSYLAGTEAVLGDIAEEGVEIYEENETRRFELAPVREIFKLAVDPYKVFVAPNLKVIDLAAMKNHREDSWNHFVIFMEQVFLPTIAPDHLENLAKQHGLHLESLKQAARTAQDNLWMLADWYKDYLDFLVKEFQDILAFGGQMKRKLARPARQMSNQWLQGHTCFMEFTVAELEKLIVQQFTNPFEQENVFDLVKRIMKEQSTSAANTATTPDPAAAPKQEKGSKGGNGKKNNGSQKRQKETIVAEPTVTEPAAIINPDASIITEGEVVYSSGPVETPSPFAALQGAGIKAKPTAKDIKTHLVKNVPGINGNHKVYAEHGITTINQLLAGPQEKLARQTGLTVEVIKQHRQAARTHIREATQ